MDKLSLDNVTLISVDGSDPELSVQALSISSRNIQFGQVKLLTFRKPHKHDGIEFINIEKLTWNAYNEFIVHRLNDYVTTEFALVIQPDGFVINPNLWSKDFLEYDYIGAPWLSPFHGDYLNQVGNGGFSLRSKKLLELCAAHPDKCEEPEDAYICYHHKEYFLKNGIKYAPVNVALRFSQDPVPNLNSTFGFHGNKSIINEYRI